MGEDNLFRHPHWEMLGRLGDLPVYRTDEDGTVEVISNGRTYWVGVER